MIRFSLSVLVAPSNRHGFLDAVRVLLEPTRVLAGCLACEFYSAVEKPDAFTLVEEWDSQEALDQYLSSNAGKTLIGALELSCEPPSVYFDQILSRAGIEVIESARRARGLLQELPADAAPERG